MAILPTVLHGLATYAGFVESLLTKLFESQMRRYGAVPRPQQKPKPQPIDRKVATKCPPA